MTTEASMSDAAIGRFYTKAAIGDLLIGSIRSRPKRVIDLGSWWRVACVCCPPEMATF